MVARRSVLAWVVLAFLPSAVVAAPAPRFLPLPLGHGWMTAAERGADRACVRGKEETKRAPGDDLAMARAFDERDAARMLGVALDTRSRTAVLDPGPAATLAGLPLRGQLATGAIFAATARCGGTALASPAIAPDATALAADPARWLAACGDGYVASVTTGARLFVGVQVRFASAGERRAFEAAGGLGGSLADVATRLTTRGPALGPHAAVVVAVHQVGGDPARLGEAVGLADGATRECAFAEVAPCANVLARAARTAQALREQIGKSDRCALLDAEVAPLPAGLGPAPVAGGPAPAVVGARVRLHQALEQQLRLGRIAAALTSSVLAPEVGRRHVSGARRERLEIDEHLGTLLAAAAPCYDDAGGERACVDAIDALLEKLERRPPRMDQLGAPRFLELCRAARAEPSAPSTHTIGALLQAARAGNLAQRDACRRAAEILDGRPELNLTGRAIVDLTPLTALPSLQRLKLGDNAIVDLTPLADLPGLAELELGGNQITDAGPLRYLFLRRLGLTGNRIADAAPLGHVATLERLDAEKNALRDPRPLCGCDRLARLRLAGNPLEPRAVAGFACLVQRSGRTIADVDPPSVGARPDGCPIERCEDVLANGAPPLAAPARR